VSNDRHATYVAVQLRAENDADMFAAIEPDLKAPGLQTQLGGPTSIFVDISERVRRDIAGAEVLSMPILLILLIFIFRGVVAATMPLLVGGLAILGAFTVTRLLTYATDVSIFALNIITMVGLGMAIDYALFIISRYREELNQGRDVAEAIRRTMSTAGRTVAVSGLTITLAMASLLIFPQVFLRSMGYGGMAAVVVAMLAALTVLPAVLAILGHRVNALRIPLLRRSRAAGTPGAAGVPVASRAAGATGAPGAGWARLARAVMRRPVLVIVGTVVFLGVLASPFTRAEFGAADERVLPAGTESRVVSERLAIEFPNGGADQIEVLVTGGDPAAATTFTQRIAALPNVTSAGVAASRGQSTLIAVSHREVGASARQLVTDIRALSPPDGARVLVAGGGAETKDMLASLARRLPLMGLLAAISTMLVLFLAFGSVVLPIKAVLMNLVSIGASFGAVVWVFQEGHFAGLLGFTSTGDLEATQLILMLAILFGLSTDYEVFLLSRVREEWDRTGDNTLAVSTGLQRTGGLITSAALLLMIVVGGFATGGISFIKMLGVGMVVAILLDATLVRALLVPATMRLLGRANWWAPGPLARVYRRYGIRESEPAAEDQPTLEPARA
jgi:RND superfamily putative drug exporter